MSQPWTFCISDFPHRNSLKQNSCLPSREHQWWGHHPGCCRAPLGWKSAPESHFSWDHWGQPEDSQEAGRSTQIQQKLRINTKTQLRTNSKAQFTVQINHKQQTTQINNLEGKTKGSNTTAPHWDSSTSTRQVKSHRYVCTHYSWYVQNHRGNNW